MTEPPKLTAKQEKFAQGVAGGLTQADAYRAAYSAEKMADKTIWERASQLMADSKVSARVAELRKELSDKQLWTREMSVKSLIKAYKVAEDQGQSSPMTAAVKELNAMHGFNAPTKLDHTSSDGTFRTLADFYASQSTDTEPGTS